MMPSPMSVQTTGMPHAAESARTSSSAPEATTPPPTYSSGRSAAAIIRAMEASTAPSAFGAGSADAGRGQAVQLDARLLDVLGHVDQHRALPAGEREAERLGDHLQQLRGAAHQEVVLGDRDAHPVGVHFLERVRADQPGGNLARDRDDGNRIELGVRDGGQQVDRARARGGKADGRASRGPRHALGQEAAGLLVADQDDGDRSVPAS